jgi:hypothetical protein
MPHCEPIQLGGTIITQYNEHNPHDYVAKLQGMTEDGLYSQCKDMIWFSAYAISRPSSDFHWMCDACYAECKRRERLNIYERAHKAISESV